ncbi:HU family DNA-binding protein [Variovorax sp. M-6]|uniref:HU family DNA-binding protein n=1 Tax=Variovorax sp. M-6 TaxID=3233041 RepID=UPI003F98A25C
MNKTELIAAIAADTNLSKADAARAFDSALGHLASALTKGETVQLLGFGNFSVSARAERSGRNPSTGEPMTIKASKAVKFTAGKALKDAVNAGG